MRERKELHTVRATENLNIDIEAILADRLNTAVEFHEAMAPMLEISRSVLRDDVYFGLGAYWRLFESLTGMVDAKYQQSLSHQISEAGFKQKSQKHQTVSVAAQATTSMALGGLTAAHWAGLAALGPYHTFVLAGYLWARAVKEFNEAKALEKTLTEAGLLAEKKEILDAIYAELQVVDQTLGSEVSDEDGAVEIKEEYGKDDEILDLPKRKADLIALKNDIEKQVRALEAVVNETRNADPTEAQRAFVKQLLNTQKERHRVARSKAQSTAFIAFGMTLVGLSLVFPPAAAGLLLAGAIALGVGGLMKLPQLIGDTVSALNRRKVYREEEENIYKSFLSSSDKYDGLSLVSKGYGIKVRDFSFAVKCQVAFNLCRDKLKADNSDVSEEGLAVGFYASLKELPSGQLDKYLDQAMKLYIEKRLAAKHIFDKESEVDDALLNSLSQEDCHEIAKQYANDKITFFSHTVVQKEGANLNPHASTTEQTTDDLKPENKTVYAKMHGKNPSELWC
ncbi:MAG: hypothetical protein ACE365_03110 [Gammaproteobacteria bacterium]